MVFDDVGAFCQASRWLEGLGIDRRKVWRLKRAEDSAIPGPSRLGVPIHCRLPAIARRAANKDVGYLMDLSDALESGAEVAAVPVPDVWAAEQLAVRLHWFGARDLAYFSNWRLRSVRVYGRGP